MLSNHKNEEIQSDAVPTDVQSETSTDAETVRQRDEYLAGWQRARADYENLKKESARERALFTGIITTDIVTAFLPLYDYLRAAVASAPQNAENAKWSEGVVHISTEFLKIVAQFGITKMETVGTQFNALQHESVGTEMDTSKEEHVVLKEVQSGFLQNGRVVRPAKVIINEINKA